ncbi:unnamed protein product [Meloidogyne enterolobii]|uniref:Uncharacterized protein n=2 Tax=Meloidogyne enterolobii TaxID=390850 RepID=A0ACB0YIE8_MELEN
MPFLWLLMEFGQITIVICITTEPYNFYYSTQLLDTGFFINLTSFICYLFVWYFVSKANNVTSTSDLTLIFI